MWRNENRSKCAWTMQSRSRSQLLIHETGHFVCSVRMLFAQQSHWWLRLRAWNSVKFTVFHYTTSVVAGFVLISSIKLYISHSKELLPSCATEVIKLLLWYFLSSTVSLFGSELWQCVFNANLCCIVHCAACSMNHIFVCLENASVAEII